MHTIHLAANLREEASVEAVVTLPPEGTVGWVDGAMVTARTELRDAAVAFVDFLFSPEGVRIQWEESDGYAATSARHSPPCAKTAAGRPSWPDRGRGPRWRARVGAVPATG